jgi:hypothetical protein
MTDKDIQMVIDRELGLLSFRVRRSAQQIDELLNPDFARSEPRDSYGLARKGSCPPQDDPTDHATASNAQTHSRIVGKANTP